MIKSIWSFWVISVVGAASLSARQLSPFCDASHFCNYSSMALDEIPSGLTADITGLNLASNSIEQINQMDLKFAVNLRILLLHSNRIRIIDDDAFRFLVKLEHLDLSKNSLTRLSPSWFRYLSSLRQLNIKGNMYSDLGARPLFSDLQKLRFLYFGNNEYFSTLRKQDLEGISVLEKLEVEARNLEQYEQGSLKSIKHIDHIILNVHPPATLILIIDDITTSVVCFELRNLRSLNNSYVYRFYPSDSVIVQKVILRNVVLSDFSVGQIAPIFADLNQLHEIEVVDSMFNGIGNMHVRGLSSVGHLEVVTIRNLTIDLFYSFTDLSSVIHLVDKIVRLTVENAKVYLMPCSLSKAFKSLEYLDLSVNLLQDLTIQSSFCKLRTPFANAFPKLRTLNVSQNALSDLGSIVTSVAHLVNFTSLDVSRNNFGRMPESCSWPQSLKFLNISGCKIIRLTTCIPQSLDVLDVSNNNLNDFRLSLPQLRELYITKNKLTTLPDAAFISSVRLIEVRENKLMDFSKEQLGKFAELETLDACGKSFSCSCQFLSFVEYGEGISKILVGWPENYICDLPSTVRGKQVHVVQLPLTECHRTLVVSLICILMLAMILVVAVLCYKLHAIWYMKMTWAWLQAKRKPQQGRSNEICYDAFVSYSEQDSEWVENIMVEELEHANPPFKLCLHKRDFMPGKWIVDNIIDSIEKSYKTLFVLSEHFVQSEWCKYELDFSHFRLFDENNDAVILILLEPIPEQTIPKRFCKLRKLMNTKTYLEWPRDDRQQQIFWFNLRTALKA
ncbi:toll-like receptor 2 [Eublepharis macularius]|uniref:Toll-like receptor 2 n=1 Tax=Eublepharis macularius TaxID=481883 RepID=A0AA97K0K8_EUBMA|nr:toll-like receptor 2 [Eublepharis macularius]XP_054846600.1 toll-like receptor 2 [Eublepharis macularius]XP_054846601.1 toll-like receptor 2 [Eublepharis macularius]